jgi:lipopolysaccharide biosynthesis glycosyltransferase
MKICYLISKDYYELTLTSIEFIQKFYKGSNSIEFFIFHFGDMDAIENSNLTFVKIERKIQQFFLNRPFVFDYFNEKILFLDSDTVCHTNIEKLYNTDLDDCTLGVVECNRLRTHAGAFKVYPPTTQLKSLVVHDEWPFFNAGVMLVDCKKWNENKYTQKFLNIFEYYKSSRYSFSDEVAFNLLLGRDQCKFLDVRWNYNNHAEMKDRRPFIVHYYGDVKNV